MNPNESPPSFSSGAIGTIDHQPFHDGTKPNAQPSTDNNQAPSLISFYPDQGKAINEPFKGEKAPSLGAMRPIQASNPSGVTMNSYSDGRPPSLSDLARGDASQTDSSYTGNEFGNVGSVPQPEMSLTGKYFNKFRPGKAINEPFKGDYYGYGEKAPSLGAMRPIQASNPSGVTMNSYSDGRPPSLSDLARGDASQTDSSYTGNEFGNVGSVPQPEMSLTGKYFNKFRPGEFHKDN